MNPQEYKVMEVTMLLQNKKTIRNIYEDRVAHFEELCKAYAKVTHNLEEKNEEPLVESGLPSLPIIVDTTLNYDKKTDLFLREMLEEKKKLLEEAKKEVADAEALLAKYREEAKR